MIVFLFKVDYGLAARHKRHQNDAVAVFERCVYAVELVHQNPVDHGDEGGFHLFLDGIINFLSEWFAVVDSDFVEQF